MSDDTYNASAFLLMAVDSMADHYQKKHPKYTREQALHTAGIQLQKAMPEIVKFCIVRADAKVGLNATLGD